MEILLRILLCIIFPPLAVMDKGCGAMILTFFLTLAGWLPGTICALILSDDSYTAQSQTGELIIRYLLCIFFPPLAVIDKGCGAMLLVAIFTLFGWVPGMIMALFMCIERRDLQA